MSVLKEAYHLLPMKENRRWPICNEIYCGQSVSSFITLFVCVLCKEQKINTEAQKSVTGLQTLFFVCVRMYHTVAVPRKSVLHSLFYLLDFVHGNKLQDRLTQFTHTCCSMERVSASQRMSKWWTWTFGFNGLDLVYKSHIKLKNSLGEQFWH